MARVIRLIPGQPGRPGSALSRHGTSGIGPLPSILARFLARTQPAGDRMSEMGAEGAMVRSRLPQHEKPREIPSGTGNPGSDRSLPQHEIPSKDGVAVPPGSDRSLRGQCPTVWQGSFDSSRDSRHRSAFATGWPGIAVPPGSDRSLPQHRKFFRFPVAPWVFDLELSTLLGESRPGHYLFRTVDS